MKYGKRIFSLLAVAASLMLLAACGQKSNCSGITFGTGGSGGSGTGGVNTGGSVCGSGNSIGGGVKDFLFFQQQGNLLNTAIFDGTSLKTNVSGLVPSLGSGATTDMVVVNKSFLYLTWVPQGGAGQVLGFTINRNGGTLTPMPASPFDASTSLVDSIVADPQGRFLVVSNSSNGEISSFAIDQTTGGLTRTAGSPLATNNFLPVSLTIDGSGKYVYATEVSGGAVFGFAVDQNTFDVTAIPLSPFFLGLSKVAGEPSGQFLLGVDGPNIAVVTIDQGTGLLVSKTDTPSAAFADSVVVHPSGNFVYAYSFGSPLEGFSFSGGALTPLAGSPFSTLPILHPLKIDQNGTAMFGFSSVGGYGVRIIDPNTGALTGGIPNLSLASSPNFAPTN
jgi:6-phosphogluconolactonase